MEQKPVSTDERYTVSFDLGGGILTARGVGRSVTAAPGGDHYPAGGTGKGRSDLYGVAICQERGNLSGGSRL